MRQFDERGVRVCGITAGQSLEAHQVYARELHDWAIQQHQQHQQQWQQQQQQQQQTTSSSSPQTPHPPSQFPLLMLSHHQTRDLGVTNEWSAVRRGSAYADAAAAAASPPPSREPPAVHSVTVILAPDRTVASALWYPSSTGRMFDELIRLMDSLQLYLNMSVATPADWTSGQPVLVDSFVTDDQAKDLFGDDGVWRTSDLRKDNTPNASSAATASSTDAASTPGTAAPSTTQRLELPYMRWTKDPTWFAPEG